MEKPATWFEADADIHQALAERNPAGLERLYDRYAGLCIGLSLKMLGDSARAEDVVQEVFLTIWRRPERFNPERGSFRTWLLTLVRNRSIDSLRGRARREGGEVPLAPTLRDETSRNDPWPALALSLERDAVREALASLPAEQRQAVELAHFGGYTHTEIATNLGVPLGTIKGRLRLGMDKLHTYLSGRGLVTV
ncbi:MAG: sigma-70 family RNA polymerase sigma factor [Candidatus Dormibacteria bacterium]